MENRKIRLAEEGLQYRKGFKWKTVAYADITRAYMRVEEVNAKVCCGAANFDMHFLMLKTSGGELLKLGVFSRAAVQEMLERLKEREENIAIGYYKEREEQE